MKFSNPLKSIGGWGFLALSSFLKILPIKLLDGNSGQYEIFWSSLSSLLKWTETWKVIILAIIIFAFGYLIGELIKNLRIYYGKI